MINFDVPWQPDDYVHRIGRTGRAGAKGIAYTLATREDAEAIAAIEKLSGHKIDRFSGEEAPEPAADPIPAQTAPKTERSRSERKPEKKADVVAPPRR